MIYQLREIWAVEAILKMIEDQKELFKIPMDIVKKYLIKGIKDELSIILIDEKEKFLNGFLYASIEEFNGAEVCFIHACVIVPDREYTGPDFMARLKKWSKEKNMKEIFLSTDKHEVGFEQKYEFKYHSTIMSLRLK